MVFAAQFDAHDLTYDFLKISLTTVLEPVLGIIVASLPMFPPAFKRGLGGETDHKSSRVRSSGLTRLRLNSSEPSRLPPGLGSLYPLPDLNLSIMESEVIGSNDRASPVDIESGWHGPKS